MPFTKLLGNQKTIGQYLIATSLKNHTVHNIALYIVSCALKTNPAAS
jgi:hypothetical protein